MTGKKYIDNVFDPDPSSWFYRHRSRTDNLNIDNLIYHIIKMEFPKKYQVLSMEQIRYYNRSKELSPDDKLKQIIKKYHGDYLS